MKRLVIIIFKKVDLKFLVLFALFQSCDCSDEKREVWVLGSLQTHFVSSIGGARQKEYRNQSWR